MVRRAVAAQRGVAAGLLTAPRRSILGAMQRVAPALPSRLELPVRVRFDEADADGAYRASAHLRAMQDVAWAHSIALGFDLDWYTGHGRFWVVRCVDLTLLAPVGAGTVLSVSTEVLAMRRIWARRASEFVAPGGSLVARGLVDWVMTTAEGAPARILPELLARFGASDGLDPAHVDPGEPPQDAATIEWRVRAHEVDPMRHANHAAYVDWLEEAARAAGGAPDLAAFPRRYRLEYLAPARPGELVLARAWRAGDGWSVRFTGETGRDVFRGRVEPA